MANKPVTTDTASNAQYLSSRINSNFSIIENAIEGCLGRGGTSESPNSMNGDLDMDFHRILNLGPPSSDNDAIRLIDLSDSDATGAASATLRSELLSTDDGYGSELIGNNLVLRATVSDLTSSTIDAGIYIRTEGFYAAGDGGGALYLMIPGNSGDGYGSHDVGANTAVIQHSGILNVRQFGARTGTGYDNTNMVMSAHNHLPAAGGTIYFPKAATADPFTDASKYFCDSSITFTKPLKLLGDGFSTSALAYTGTGAFITTGVYNVTLEDIAIQGVSDTDDKIYVAGSKGIVPYAPLSLNRARVSHFEYGIEWAGGYYHHFQDAQIDRCRIGLNNFNANNITFIGGRIYHVETALIGNGGVGPVIFKGVALEYIHTRVVTSTGGVAFAVSFDGCYFENRPTTLTLKGIGLDTDYYDSGQVVANGAAPVNFNGNFVSSKGFTRIINHSGLTKSVINSQGNLFFLYDDVDNDTLEYVMFFGTESEVFCNDRVLGSVGIAQYFNADPDYGMASDPIAGTPIVQYPLEEDWITPGSLLNSWTNDGGAGAADFGYYKDRQGRVHLRGRVDGGSSTSVTLYNLPAGYRPEFHHYQAGCVVATGIAIIRVTLGGDVNVEFPTTTNNISLDGISFTVA